MSIKTPKEKESHWATTKMAHSFTFIIIVTKSRDESFLSSYVGSFVNPRSKLLKLSHHPNSKDNLPLSLESTRAPLNYSSPFPSILNKRDILFVEEFAMLQFSNTAA